MAEKTYIAIIAMGMIGCFIMTWLRVRLISKKSKVFIVFIPLSVLLGFFFAHLFYAIVTLPLSMYTNGISTFFVFWEGQYMLYGAVTGVILAAVTTAHIMKIKATHMLDALAPIGLVMIAVARFAEGLLMQGYGVEIVSKELMFFPVAIFDAYYEVWYQALFMVEGIYALVFGILLLMRKRQTFNGDLTLLMLVGYASIQIFFESMRRDDVLRWGFVRCSQVISAIVVLAVLGFYQRKANRPRTVKVFEMGLAVMLLGFVAVMEFAREGKVELLYFMNEASCYMVMLAACILLFLTCLKSRHYAIKAGEKCMSVKHRLLLRRTEEVEILSGEGVEICGANTRRP